MDNSVEVLIKLVRIALGNDADLSLPNVDDWRKVYDLSLQHGVAAIAVDGLQKIYDSSSELSLTIDMPGNEKLKYQWFSNALFSEDVFKDYYSVLHSLLDETSVHDIPILLIKGYVMSLNYPVPEHRSVGDIDIFPVGKNKWNLLNDLMKEKPRFK